MPKKRTTTAANPPADDLETTDAPAPKPRRAKLRAGASSATHSHFGAPPRGATHWGVRRFLADGRLERIGGPSPDGSMVVHEWPLEELDDAIASRLPPGRYKLEWIGDHPTKGQRTHLSWGREFEVAGAKAPPIASASSPPATSSASSSPLAASVDALGALRSIRSLVREERELVDQGVSQQLSALAQLATVMRPTTPQADPQIGQALTAIAGTLQNLNARIAALEEGDDDEEDDDEEEEEDDAGDVDGDAGELFTPRGESHGDVAVAAGLNKLASFLDGIKPGAEAFAVEWLQDQAAEMAKRRAAREAANGANALNGHAIGVTSSSSSNATPATDAQG